MVSEARADPMPRQALIVVPTLGARVAWLRAALESISDQSRKARVVVIAPKSRIDELRASIVAADVELVAQAGRGLSAAINEGWARRRGEAFLGWLGDDDLLARGSLERAIATLETHPSAVAVYGRLRVIDKDSRTLLMIKPGRLARWLMHHGPDLVPQPGSLFRASAVDEVGGLDETLKEAMDLDLFLKLSHLGTLHYIPHELASFRRHESSITEIAAGQGQESRLVRARCHATPEAVVTAANILSKFWYRLHVFNAWMIRNSAAPYGRVKNP